MRAFAAALALAALAGCAGVKSYPTDSAGNVVLRAELDAGVRAAVHVHAVDRNCETQYQGRVALNGPATSIAIPADRPSYLIVSFNTSSFLRGSSSTSVGTLLRPRRGQAYEIAVRYRSDLYDVRLREGNREIVRQDLGACRVS